jgi:hypothetical protein
MTNNRDIHADSTLTKAAALFAERNRLDKLLRDNTEALRLCCREYDQTAGLWGTSPCHLRRAAELQGYL